MGSIGVASGESNFNLDMDEVAHAETKVNNEHLGKGQPLLSDRINEHNRSSNMLNMPSLLGQEDKNQIAVSPGQPKKQKA